MSEEIIEVLDAICEKFGVAIDWTSENVVPYAKKLLEKCVTYEIASSAVWILLLVSFTIGTFFIVKRLWKMYLNPNNLEKRIDDESREVLTAIATATFVVLAFAAIFVTVFQIMDIVEALTFPEKMILRELKNITGTA